MKTKERAPSKRTVDISNAARLWTPPQGLKTEIPQVLHTSPASCLGRQTRCLPEALAEATSAVFYRQEKEYFWWKELVILGCQNLKSRTYPGKKTVHPGNVTGWPSITNISCSDIFTGITKKSVLISSNTSSRDMKDSKRQQFRHHSIHKADRAGAQQAFVFS